MFWLLPSSEAAEDAIGALLFITFAGGFWIVFATLRQITYLVGGGTNRRYILRLKVRDALARGDNLDGLLKLMGLCNKPAVLRKCLTDIQQNMAERQTATRWLARITTLAVVVGLELFFLQLAVEPYGYGHFVDMARLLSAQ